MGGLKRFYGLVFYYGFWRFHLQIHDHFLATPYDTQHDEDRQTYQYDDVPVRSDA